MIKKKKPIIMAVLAACAVFLGVHIVMAGVITEEQLKNIEDKDVIAQVAQIVLEDTGIEPLYGSEGAGRIDVYMKNVMGDDREEAIISVFYGPKQNITAVYKPTNGGYEFAGTLGTFFSPQDIIVKNFRYGNPIIFLSDYINQKIGDFEESTYLYGYTWIDDENQFINVISVPMNIETQWLNNGIWQKAERRGKAVYENSAVPNVKADFNQFYYTAKDDGSKMAASDEAYTLQEEWKESEVYYWSDEWKRFIEDEKIEKATGEKVAILSDWNKLPYSRAPEFEPYLDYTRILRKDGTMDAVPASALSDIEKKTVSEIKSM